MFCPKCGSHNAEETKFCRGCGTDLSHVPPALDIIRPDKLPMAEKHIELFSSGLRGLLVGSGFLIASGVAFAISLRYAVLGLFFLAFASFFTGTGIARLFQARALKRLIAPEPIQPTLPSDRTAYIEPSHDTYETDELAALPSSVTEHTTRHLKNS